MTSNKKRKKAPNGVGALLQSCDGLRALTQRGSVGHQDVDAFGDEVPLVQQGLSSRQVEAPAVEPGRPAAESAAVRPATQTELG